MKTDPKQPEEVIVEAFSKAQKLRGGASIRSLSERTGLDRSTVAALVNGTGNPTLSTLKRYAEGLGMEVKLEFIPIEEERKSRR